MAGYSDARWEQAMQTAAALRAQAAERRSYARGMLRGMVERTRLLQQAGEAARETLRTASAFHVAAQPAAELCRGNMPPALLGALAQAGYTERDLPALSEALIAAYEQARMLDDFAAIEALRSGLLQIGRHLAVQLGPNACGITLH